MVGVDATSKQQEAIQKGEELGVLSQNPYAMGYQTMWAAIQSTAPKKETKVDKKVLLDPVWIDAENIKGEDIANYLYNLQIDQIATVGRGNRLVRIHRLFIIESHQPDEDVKNIFIGLMAFLNKNKKYE